MNKAGAAYKGNLPSGKKSFEYKFCEAKANPDRLKDQSRMEELGFKTKKQLRKWQKTQRQLEREAASHKDQSG